MPEKQTPLKWKYKTGAMVSSSPAGWLEAHFQWMSWSVVGLYAALWAEIGTRFFEMRYFWWIVMIAIILTTIIGRSFIKKFENNSLHKFKSFDTRTA